jgi:hypothetical protein
MEKIHLSSNHKRSLSSSIQLVEKLVDEIETLMSHPKTLETQTVERDLPDDEKETALKAIGEIKVEVKRLAEKYELKKQVVSESRFLDSRKTKIWEILHNSEARRMDAFGKFPENIRDIYDADIEHLLELVSKL